MPTTSLVDTNSDTGIDPPPPYPSRRRPRRPPIHESRSCPEEDTPLLPPSPRPTRPRTVSVTTSASAATSVAHTLLSLFQTDADSNNIEVHDDLTAPPTVHTDDPSSSNWLSKRAWKRYFRPLIRRAYYAALFHLLFINFLYALLAFVCLFVLTLVSLSFTFLETFFSFPWNRQEPPSSSRSLWVLYFASSTFSVHELLHVER
jgi:hypothetical protein